MTNEQLQSLQVIFEQLSGALYDITEGNPSDAIDALQNCIARLSTMGVNQ